MIMSVLDDYAEEEVVENPTLRAAYNLAPLHQNEPLHWDYEVHLIGEKIYDKTIHLCEVCELPILKYGRMLPCKHIFCFDCALKCDKFCRRCGAKVQKVEKSALGTVYVCTHGAPKHSTKGCRRTYLSQRDLQSHNAHRHMPKSSSSSSSSSKQQQQQSQTVSSSAPPAATTVQPVPNQLPMTQQQAQQQQQQVNAQQQQKQQLMVGGLSGHGPAGARGGLLSPSQAQAIQGGMSHQMMMASSSSSQSSPLIPNLGGLTAGQALSPHLQQPSMSPKPSPLQQQQGMNVSYSGSGSSDMYRPGDLPPNMGLNPLQQHRHMHQSQQQQLQQQQQQQGLPAHMQQGIQGAQPSFGQQAHFQVPTSLMQQQQQPQQMGMNTPQQNMMHQAQMSHHHHQHHHHQQQQQPQQQQHPGVSAPQGSDSFSPQNATQQNVISSPGLQPMAMTMASNNNNTPQPRTNNLITVPIQDEGQYRPPPFANTSMVNQANVQVSSFNSQTRSSTHSQSFPQQHAMSGGFFSKLNPGGTGGQAQGMMVGGGGGGVDQNQGIGLNPGQGNPQGLNFSPAGGPGQGPNMVANFNQSAGQGASPRIGFNQPGGAFNPGLRMNQMPGLAGVGSGGGGGGSGGGGGNMPRNLAGVVQAMSMAAAARAQGAGLNAHGPGMRSQGVGLNAQGPGMMSQGSGLNAQSGGGRFPPPAGRWPHGVQPRMGSNQGQPRPHDSSFNQGPYYN